MRFVSTRAAVCYIHRPRASEAGFTLVEVMVAITILSLVMLTTVTALRTLANTQGTIEKMTDRVDEVRSVSIFLRELLESALVGDDLEGLTLGGGSGSDTNSSYFRSGKDFVEVESTILFGERYGGSYAVRVAQEGSELVLRWQELSVDGKRRKWQDMPSRVMVGQLEELTVATRQDYREDWSDRPTRNAQSPPALVRLRIKASGRYWPDIIMPVQR